MHEEKKQDGVSDNEPTKRVKNEVIEDAITGGV